LSRQGNTQGYKRVDGPSDEEVAEKKKKQREVTVYNSLAGKCLHACDGEVFP
jgi:hypothetical protein